MPAPISPFMRVYDEQHLGERDKNGVPQVTLRIICDKRWLKGTSWWRDIGRHLTPEEERARLGSASLREKQLSAERFRRWEERNRKSMGR